jgi:hypothetical protein
MIEKLKSQRNGILIIYEDQIYNLDSKSNKTEKWRCRKRGCLGKIEVKDDIFINSIAHSHPKQQQEILKLKLANKIKQNAEKTRERPETTIVNSTLQMSNEEISVVQKRNLF